MTFRTARKVAGTTAIVSVALLLAGCEFVEDVLAIGPARPGVPAEEPADGPPPQPVPDLGDDSPADPAPLDPQPIDPVPPGDPADEPEPADPGEPDPDAPVTDPDPVEPDPADPTEPEPADPDPVDPDEPEPADPVEPDPVEPEPVAFTYLPPGDLEPGSGEGIADNTIFAPGMVYPVQGMESFINSQVYRPGGMAVGGDQCDPSNYQYPWRDNFCETRSSDRKTLNCPRDRVHQGQDIRAGDAALCQQLRSLSPTERTLIPVVAAEDGYISYIGRFTVNLRAGEKIYRYMHLNMAALQVAYGDEVKAGDKIGYLSNDFGGTPTTFHLHFELKQNIDGLGWTWVNAYQSLVEAYEAYRGGRGALVEAPTEGD